MNLVNTEYITLKQLLDSIKGDFKKYFEGGIIDVSGLYKIISYTNSIAGIRINPIECSILEIENGVATLPDNLKKVKSIDIISNFKVPSSLPFYQNWTEQVCEKPKEGEPVYTPLGCINDCGVCYWTIPYKQSKEQFLVFTEHSTLTPSIDQCNKHTYKINRDESLIEFGVTTGKAIITYYIDMDAIGLIPKQPQLYFFYEWSVKVKILQDIFMNSEDDVERKLQYAEKQMNLTYVDFDNYIKSESIRQLNKRYKEEQAAFYNKWFIPFY